MSRTFSSHSSSEIPSCSFKTGHHESIKSVSQAWGPHEREISGNTSWPEHCFMLHHKDDQIYSNYAGGLNGCAEKLYNLKQSCLAWQWYASKNDMLEDMNGDGVRIHKDLLCLSTLLCSQLDGGWNGLNHRRMFFQFSAVSSHERSTASSFIEPLQLCGFVRDP